QFENTADIDNNDIANGDEIGYKGGEENLYSQGSKIPKDILKTKPSYSPIPDGWFKKGGSIKIENGNWTYINSKGDTVTYINEFAQFNGDEINIGKFRYRAADFRRVNKLLHNKPKNPEYTWHHKEDGETLQLVQKDIHKEFTHKGGISVIKNSKK
ncbi:MAG: HNH endonuclease, partial [Eubacteriaceae bacterium]